MSDDLLATVKAPQSAQEKAEYLLAFREKYAPGNKRFYARGMSVENGERGSGQKIADFGVDDLSALMADLAAARAEAARLRELLDDFFRGLTVVEHDADHVWNEPKSSNALTMLYLKMKAALEGDHE